MSIEPLDYIYLGKNVVIHIYEDRWEVWDSGTGTCLEQDISNYTKYQLYEASSRWRFQ